MKTPVSLVLVGASSSHENIILYQSAYSTECSTKPGPFQARVDAAPAQAKGTTAAVFHSLIVPLSRRLGLSYCDTVGRL